MTLLVSLSTAATAPALLGQAAGGTDALKQLALIPLMFLIFYFLLIRPQAKKQREMQDWLKSLKKGDEVVTQGGLVGKIAGLTDQIVTLELQEKVRVRVMRTHITAKAPGQAPAGPEPKQ